MSEKIPKGWKWLKVEDFAEVVSGGTPSTDKPEFWNGDIAWITPKDLSDFKFRYIRRGERNISRKGLESSNAKLLPKGTVLLSSRAPVGYLAIAKNELSTNQGFQSLVPKENVITEYLYYLLKDNIEYLKSQASGTTFGELSKSTLKKLLFLLPPLPEQKAIAEVLSSIDDKIDLLHRQNKTLEEMAMTLFRKWFIEDVKEDWEEVKLGEYFDLLGGFPFKSKDYSDFGKYKIITIKNVQDGYLDISNSQTIENLPQNIKPYQILEIGDILISLTGNVGRICIVDTNNCLLNQRVAKIVPKNSGWKPFAYFYFKRAEITQLLTNLAKGSAQLNLSPIETLKLTDTFPSSERIEKFNKIVQPIFEKILTNKQQIRRLEQLRDTLLPKLMSGEVRIMK